MSLSRTNRIYYLLPLGGFIMSLLLLHTRLHDIGVPQSTKTQHAHFNDSPKSEEKSASPKTHAVIHMGPHKTGTTTIQLTLGRKKHILTLKDGYEVPLPSKMNTNGKKSTQINHFSFVSCFEPPNSRRKDNRLFMGIDAPCNSDALLSVLDIARRKRNLFLSAERFDNISSEGLGTLSMYILPHWDKVTPVIYYRRFYSWIVSIYSQIIIKNRKLSREITILWESSIISFLQDFFDNPNNNTFGGDISARYTLSLVERVEQYFDGVVVVNFHNDTFHGPDESLFCDAISDTPHMCEAIRADEKEEHANKSPDHNYQDLVYAAMKAGLIKKMANDEIIESAKMVVLPHHNNVIKRELEMICPSSELLEKVWKLSLKAEKKFFPDGVGSLREDFEKAATTSLCKVDLDKVLEEGGDWRLFFENGEFERKKNLYQVTYQKNNKKRQIIKGKVPYNPK